MKFLRIAKILIGAVGCSWFMLPIIYSNIFNIGSICGLLFFGILFLSGVFQNMIKKLAEKNNSVKYAKNIVTAGFIILTVIFSVESVLMLNANMKKPEEKSTLIVLGCLVNGERPSQMLSFRIHAAERFLKENPESVAVLSGGQGEDEDIPEALCMYRELVKMGISPSRLYMEDKSTTTRENIAFSLEKVQEENLSKNIAIVTNNFHLYRASLSVTQQGFMCSCIPAYTPLLLLPTYIMREYAGILAQFILS